MEDKRTAFAILLIILVVMVYSDVVLTPRLRPPAPQTTTPGAAPAAASPSAPQTQPSLTAVTPPGSPAVESQTKAEAEVPSPAELKKSPVTVVENGAFVLTISHLGARGVSGDLLEYRARLNDSAAYGMINSSENLPLPLGVLVGGINDAHTHYTMAAATEGVRKVDSRFILENQPELALTFRGALPNGTEITKIFKFYPRSYLFNVEVRLSKPASDGSSLWLEWTDYLADAMTQDRLNPKQVTILGLNDKLRHVSLASLPAGLGEPAQVKWTSLDDKYFAAILIPSGDSQTARVGREGNLIVHGLKGKDTEGYFSIYMGPKEYDILSSSHLLLERSIDLGFFSFLAYPLLMLLRLFHNILGNYGLAIVLLTLAVKGVFFPLTRASMRSMKAMQDLQPEMKALRERIKDPTQLNQEVLALYKKHGVNPMGGCLPILIQIPVFFGLYSALQHAIELRHAPFALWIKDLSAPEKLVLFGINMPVMILLMGGMMFLQQYLTPNPSMDPAQRKMMLWMSLVFTGMFLIYPFPAGLALYMLVNSLISVVQQMYTRTEHKGGAFMATGLASVGIFLAAYVLTLI